MIQQASEFVEGEVEIAKEFCFALFQHVFQFCNLLMLLVVYLRPIIL